MTRPVIYLLNGPGAEQRLVAGLRRGEAAAYRQLYEAFAPSMERILRRLFPDGELVRDAIQGTFLTVFRKIDQFDGRAALLTWMTRIAIREAQELVRRRSRQEQARERLRAIDYHDHHGHGAGPAVDPEQACADQELYQQVRALVEALPEEKRLPLLLFEMEGFDVQEIAEILGVPRGTILARLSRTRAELRDALGVHVRTEAHGRRTHE